MNLNNFTVETIILSFSCRLWSWSLILVVWLKPASSRQGLHGETIKMMGYQKTPKKASTINKGNNDHKKKKKKITYASSSCFIFVNSSFVIEPSPSPSFCSFSLEASKSGLGGAGGICNRTKSLILRKFSFLEALYYCHHKRLSGKAKGIQNELNTRNTQIQIGELD